MDEGSIQLWTFVIAVVALIQPWLISVWKRIMRRGKVEIYEAGELSVGFMPQGAAVRLFGTLRAVHEEQFIRKIELVVQRRQDSATHRFEWRFLNYGLQRIPQRQDVAFEIPAGIMLVPSQPQRFDITFTDVEAENRDTAPLLDRLREAWDRKYWDAFQDWRKANPNDATELENSVASDLSDTFVQSDEYKTAVEDLSHMCYWDAGTYSIQFKVLVADRERPSVKRWNFELSKDDASRLRFNAAQIAQASVDRRYQPLNWAICEYLPPEAPPVKRLPARSTSPGNPSQ